MDRLKKLNGSMIAAIVLSVLLIMSVTAGATLAWFGSRDAASASLTMGEAIVVTIGEDYKQGEGELAMNLPVDQATGGLLPGMSVVPNVKVQLQQSNTNALLRARFITSVEYPDNYVDAAYSNLQKYEDTKVTAAIKSDPTKKPSDFNLTSTDYVTASGRVLDSTKYPKDNVYAGDMYYDYYNYLGQRMQKDGTILTQEEQDDESITEELKHTKKIHLSRVKVRDAIAKEIGETVDEEAPKDEDKHGWVINGIRIAVTAENAAELEIRQRGVDLTDAINRVLQGQGGYSINSATGELISGGIKYTRRVADGWAYREADQAWYYLGSQTNGFVIGTESTTLGINYNGNPDGKTETVTTTQVAKDIASYSTTQVGNKTVQTPNYATLGEKVDGKPAETNPYATTITENGGNKNDMTRNYLGGTDADYAIDRVRNEIGVLNQKTIASVDLSQGDVSIDFLTKRFVLPTFINNDYAKAQVTFNFTVEAVQDYLVDPLQESTAAADRLPNNLVNAILVFNNAYPQTLYPHSTAKEDKLRATGCTANILPGGGDSGITGSGNTAKTSPEWKNSKYGEVEVTYVNTGTTEGDRYSYGYLKDATIGTNGKATAADDTGVTAPTATAYVFDADAGDDGKITSVIKGFGVKTDEYGDFVADYTVAGWYVRGTASSLGIAPYITAQVGTYIPVAKRTPAAG